ncbi:MAG: 4-(cytidine 5'-diphospho)-2-C-methyl-D-erythritol kinase [Candidatus Delongbacteria bacterium]
MGQEWLEGRAPAKLNLGLRILGRRPDGFHELESVFVPLELHDTLRLRPAERDLFRCSDPALPAGADNLVLKALAAWRTAARAAGLPGADQPVELELHKRIPAGAGLGGGSSDAAACLKLLNACFAPGLELSQLQNLCLTLGSDVPFFLSADWAHVTGRGEVLTPLAPLFEDVVVLVWPGLHVSTAWAYSCLSASLTKQGLYASFQGSHGFIPDPGDAAGWPGNDFESVVFAAFPVLAGLKQILRKSGARYAAMSGSGSALYGLFDSVQSASRATQQLETMVPVVLLTRPASAVSP